MENFGLSRVFGSDFVSLMSDVLDNFDNERWLKPHYELKDNGDNYEVAVKYDDERDTMIVDYDKDDCILSISVCNDLEKTNGASSCTYYGRFAIRVPDDCDLDSVEKTIDKDKNEMKFSFKKLSKKDEKTFVENNEDYETNYRVLYNNLLKEYNRKVEKLENEIMNLDRENKKLAKKLESIKSLFN